MKKVTTTAIAKVAAVATGLAMATSMLSFASVANAALSASQVQSILSLLSSFGADASTIANVQASLTGGTPVSTPVTSGSCAITKDLTVGATGAQVTTLQNALRAGGYMPAGVSGYFGSATQAGVIKWQKAAGVSPAAGYFGAKSRAVFCGTVTATNPGSPVVVGSGTGLKVMLSPSSPNGSVLVQGQAIGDLADFVFANPTASPITVTGLSFKRIGVSNDSALTNVYLYNNGMRLTDSAGVSASAFSYNAANGIFTVPAGSSYMVSVRSDIAGSTQGQQIGVSLVSVSGATLDASVSFPVMGGYQTVSAANLATVSYSSNTTPSTTSVSPQNDFPLWQNTVSVSTNPVKLSSMKFTNLGSIDSSYVINLRLYVDGVQVGNAMPMASDRTVTFDLTANPAMLSTQSHVVKVLANVTGGASRTVQLSVQRSADAMFVDSQLGQPVSTVSNGSQTTFTAVSAGVVTINSVSGATGVSVSLASNSPNQSVAVGASSVKWASFSMLASGENVKVSDLYVYASTTLSSGALDGVGGLKNGKIMVNGVQVGSTKDIASITYPTATTASTDFSLGSSLILPAGVTTIVDVYADAKTTASANLASNDAVVVSLAAGSSNAQGQSSLNSANVPSAATSGNSITVTSSTLTATKYTGYGSQTMIAGQNAAKIGAFTLSTGSTEGVTVNTISFDFGGAVSSTITNLTLKDDATGAILGSVRSTPSQTGNSFAVNLDIPASSSKTVDIYADILSGAQAGTLQATIRNTTTGTGDLTGTQACAAGTCTSEVTVPLQSILLGNGTLTATRGAGDPTSNNVIAGASSVMVGEFNFAASNSSYAVQNLAILVPNGSATSVTNVTLKYKDPNGTAQSVTQPLSVNAANAYATATFTGLNMYVPLNDSANLDVYVGTPTIASGATSGAPVNVILDRGGVTSGNNTFRATNGAGAATTLVNSGSMLASNGTFYVRKSIPTIATVQPASGTVPQTGQALYKFTVSADPAGAVEWSKIKFNVSTSTSPAVTLTNVYLVDDAAPGTNLLDNTTSSASTTNTSVTIDLTKNSTQPQYLQVAAGSQRTFDLVGTVAGYGASGSTLTISLAADNSSIPNEAANTGTGNFEWSDRSAASHAAPTLGTNSSADYTNGFLVKNFTSSGVTYSK